MHIQKKNLEIVHWYRLDVLQLQVCSSLFVSNVLYCANEIIIKIQIHKHLDETKCVLEQSLHAQLMNIFLMCAQYLYCTQKEIKGEFTLCGENLFKFALNFKKTFIRRYRCLKTDSFTYFSTIFINTEFKLRKVFIWAW